MGVKIAVLAAAMAAMGVTSVQTAAAQAVAAQIVPAQRPVATADAKWPDGFIAFALPYSPYLFDLVVYAGRSVAEITYGTRRYDPVTRSLVVTDLEIRRDALQASIGQLRVSGDEAVYENVAVDTRALPLDPTTRAVLRKLDREIVTGDVALTGRVDAAAADYDLSASLRIDGAGTLEITADLEGFHVLAPLEGFDDAEAGGSPKLAGQLRSARIAFADAGLASVLYEVFGGQQGMTAEQARGTASMMAGIGVTALFSELPGGQSPRLQEMARGWSATIQSFLTQPDRLEVSLDPASPLDLASLTQGAIGAEDILALNPTVVAGTSQLIALVDPTTITLAPDGPIEAVLPAAEALIEGRGVPQDIARGVTLLLPAAGSDNRAAIGLLARALALDPGVAIAQEQLRGAYVAMLLAKADRLSVQNASLDALRRRLSPDELAVAEDEALQRWRRTKIGESQRQIEVGAFEAHDWSTIRRLAFAYYEGATMPRNLMRAYGWASIAAAGGDRIAAGLRDNLTAAVSEGRIVLPMERARKATDDLWGLIISDSSADGAPDADAEQPDVKASDSASPGSPSVSPDGTAEGAPDADDGNAADRPGSAD
ncbi:hypothetical protein [Aurantimonas sp. A3-2-R12]|uniref:hypothetical protein n=1 Tax=Aurantimonas sp. A3-2-R12 TaxID=3114362 RepID=UPI002E17552F|nr:hypothetical protein [Aurantimonas sp. A3-2-R12]